MENMSISEYRKYGQSNRDTPTIDCKLTYLAYMFRFVFVLGCWLVTASLSAQEYKIDDTEMKVIKKTVIESDSIPEMTPEELEAFKIAIENKVNELQNNIVVIADKEIKRDIRIKAKKSALTMFIPRAEMQVSQKNSTKLKTYKMAEYFDRLMALPYTRVEIRFYDFAYISNLYKGSDGMYHATATIFQEFKGISSDDVIYTDRTTKTIEIVVEYAEDEFFEGVMRWIVKLGNIRVLETK